MKLMPFLIALLILLSILGIYIYFKGAEPSFPENISDYHLVTKPFPHTESYFGKPECVYARSDKVCGKIARLEYLSYSQNISVHFMPGLSTYGDWESYLEGILPQIVGKEVSTNIYQGKEGWELYWRSRKFPLVTVQLYDHKTPGNDKIDLNNPVVKYFLEKYPPIKW